MSSIRDRDQMSGKDQLYSTNKVAEFVYFKSVIFRFSWHLATHVLIEKFIEILFSVKNITFDKIAHRR